MMDFSTLAAFRKELYKSFESAADTLMNISDTLTTSTLMLDNRTIRIPMKLKKCGGRKDVIVPDGLD